MQQLLELVRSRALTFDQRALSRRSALERFENGKLGMILGYRDLTPRLRAKQGLIFDVMPLPKLSSGATVSSMSGMCISSESEHTSEAADLLASIISDDGASRLADTGYVMPANLDVVNDDVFLQSGQRPLHGEVFADEVRDTRLLPTHSPVAGRAPCHRQAAQRPLLPAGDRAAAGQARGDRRGFGAAVRPLAGDQSRCESQCGVPVASPSESPSP